MDGKKCHRKTPKNHSKPVKFLTVPKYYKNEKNKEKYQKSKLLTNPLIKFNKSESLY